MAADPAAQQALVGTQIFEILRHGHKPLGGLDTIATAGFASYQAMRDALSTGANGRIGLDPWIRAVLYDDEAWPRTPFDEQAHPGAAMSEAAALAHRHHLAFLAAPGLDLTSVLAPGASGRAGAYLRLGLARDAARVADVVDIQAQSLERNPGTYAAFVAAAAGQARAANPAVVVLAGLSTNPPGLPPTARQLAASARRGLGSVDGFWMNVPVRGHACPACGRTRPGLAVSTVLSLAG